MKIKLFRMLSRLSLAACALWQLQATAATASGDTDQITLIDILTSTLHRHPKSAALEAKIEQVVAKELEAKGAFDWQIDHLHQSRHSGFYDGWFSQQNVSRQLPFANAKIQAGYRASEGNLPVYEEYYRTLNGGEPNLKLSISLLRDRVTDPKRQAVREASLGILMEQQIQNLSLNSLLQDAGNAYINWLQSHQELKVAQELLDLAITRKKGIILRVANGDLAKAVELEFETTLFSRRAIVTQQQQNLDVASLRLSLYLRTPQGTPSKIDADMRPVPPESLMPMLDEAIATFDHRLDQHPSLQALSFRNQQLQTRRKLSETQMLPNLNVNMTLARDYGEGSETLQGNEAYVGVEINVPLERRKAKGKLRAVNAEIKGLELEQQQVMENLDNMVQQQRLVMQNQQQLLGLHRQQAELAQQLAKFELQRFRAGDSDLFLLNAREIASAEAKLQVVKTYTDILKQKINALAQAGRLSQLAQAISKPSNE